MRKDKAETDKKLALETQRIADYTFWLAIFTLAVSCIAVLQAGLFIWQLLYMRRSLRDAEDAAETARVTAETAKEQVALTRMGIVDLERAYIAVGPSSMQRNFKVPIPHGYSIPSDPKEVTVILTVTNTGRTSATIRKVYGEFSQKPPLGNTPVYLNRAAIDTDLALQAGATEFLTPFEFKDDFTDPQFFWGYIEYSDIFKYTRTSRFCMMIFPEDYPSSGKMQLAGSDGWREGN